MVVRVEERIASIASPELQIDGSQVRRVCTATHEGNRYIFYSADSMLVILRENQANAITNNPRSEAKRLSQFDLWQVWNANDTVRCVRFNTTTKRVARGALALCLDDGRVVLMTPSSGTSHLTTAAPPPVALTRTSSRLTIKTSEADLKPVSSAAGRRSSVYGAGTRSAMANASEMTAEYVKIHLQLQLPTWQECIRWKADNDRLMDRVEWVESGDDLWLIGAGERITTWKLIEESGVVAYQQLSFAVVEPDQRIWNVDMTVNGRFAATSGKHDRILKLWSLGELAHDGTPVCSYLPHRRALVSMSWVKPWHSFKMQGSQVSPSGVCDMLFTLDRAGTISIWREHVASPSRSFTLWKSFSPQEFATQSQFGDIERSAADQEGGAVSQLKIVVLVVNDWARANPKPAPSYADSLLDEDNVMAALSQFHYGYTSLDEVRRNELQNQRMDGPSKANAKLMGARSGMDADSHFGETFIAGNMPLQKTFVVNLVLGVHENGDISFYRIESVPFAVSAPRVSQICSFSGLRGQLSGASVYTACSADYKDREAGFTSFLLEIVYQPQTNESHLKSARLKLQADAGGPRGYRSVVTYTVQMCEVGDVSPSVVSATKTKSSTSSQEEIIHASLGSGSQSYRASSTDVVLVSAGTDLDVFREGSQLGGPRIGCRTRDIQRPPSSDAVYSVLWTGQGILFTFTGGKLIATSLSSDSSAALATKALFSEDDPSEPDQICQLIICGVSASQKKNWSSAPSSFFFSAPASEEPAVLKDFCVVIALAANRNSLIVWVFSMDPKPASTADVLGDAVIQLEASPLKVFRRMTVEVPGGRELKAIAPALSFDLLETLFVSIDGPGHTLSLWGFPDMDDLSSLGCVHSTDIASVLRSANTSSSSSDSHDTLQFFSKQQNYTFRDLAVSLCGRAALLFEEEAAEGRSPASRNSALCIVSLFDTWHESVVVLDQKKFGQVLSIKWTQPIAPTQDCQVVLLTPTVVAVVSVDSNTDREGHWDVTWTSSRLTIKPRVLSDMLAFPRASIGLGTGIARLNFNDLIQAPPLSTVAVTDVASSSSHPLSLLFLLMRGSFSSLDRVVNHVKQSIEDHEKTCYLKMQEDQELRKLPLMALNALLGQQDSPEERSPTFTKGKGSTSSSSSTVTSRGSLARASDLFAMDFGSVRRASLVVGIDLNGNLDSLFNTPTGTDGGNEEARLSIESAEVSAFFTEHKASMVFLPEELRDVFVHVVSSSRKLIAWDKDSARLKDEPTLRFAASLLWPHSGAGEDRKPTSDASGDVPLDAEEAASATASIGICSEQVAWAALSEHQSELLQECFPTPTLTMQELTQLRLPFWLKSHAKLSQFVEKAAQAEFAASRDPFRVALIYILLGKTKLLVSLFKMGNESKIADLLGNDFSDARWKNAAVKNAYVLKAKRRHELSAAFFLLGGKVQEAMSVAEDADRTMVLSFLIARLSERWDLGGSSDGSGDGFSAGFADASFTGLSTSLRSFSTLRMGGSEATPDAYKDVCKEYLKNTVWSKAQACGDVFTQFLVKHLLGESTAALQALLTIPHGDVTSVFDTTSGGSSYPVRRIYWRVFGQSLLGAADLARYVKSSVPRMTSVMKLQMMHLQAIALNRLFAMGFNTIALYHQRDLAAAFKVFCKENVPNSSVVRGALLSARSRILSSVISGQAVRLSSALSKSIVASLRPPKMIVGAQPIAEAVRQFEDSMDAELESLVKRGGDFSVANLPETSEGDMETQLKAAALETFRQSGRTAVEDFLYQHWMVAAHGPGRAVPLHRLLESVVDGVASVASGDLVSTAVTAFHSKHVDQVCEELLNIAENLLCWLVYSFHTKRHDSSAEFGAPPASMEYVRVVTAAVYSVIAICSRYIKSPCCLHRVFTAIFPHLEPLPKKTIDELKEIAIAEVCVHCAALKASEPAVVPLTSSLQRDVPVLYQTVQMLRQNLHLVVEEVRTNRLDLTPPTLFYSYCQYWTLVMSISATKMPAHISKVAVDGANPHGMGASIARKLVQSWTTYAGNLTKHASRLALSELTESFFRPYNNVRAPSTPTGSTPVTPRESSGATASGAASSTSATSGTASPSTVAAVLSPHGRDRREARQLLRCSCDRCPWLLLLKVFVDKDELLLRINSQLECCSEKIKEEISWGHLPDFPSRKAALTRSQKILLSAAAAGKGADVSDMLEKRMLQSAPTIQLDAHCIYRSEVSIKSLCFNRSTETAELILCSSRGLARTASVEYSDGTKYQFKGMYTFPQPSSVADTSLPSMRRKPSDMASITRSSAESAQRTLAEGGSAVDAKAPSFKPTAVESHPFLPLFVSGNQKGKVHLWSYDSLGSVCEFQTRDVVATYPLGQALSSRRDIKKIHFDSLGQQMGAVDNVGRLFMWKFANLDREQCYRELDCHDKGAKALQFINSSSIVATAGSSSDKRSVCMWDLLLPNSKALIAAPACHPAGAASLTFSPTHQLLISGGEGGSISVFDVRQRRVLHTITNAHETAITTLELHPSGRCVLSGSASGDIKIWSLPIFRELVAVSKVHAKPSFLSDAASNILGDAASNMAINVTSSSWGVTDAFATDDYFFTSGTDGSVQRFRVPSLGAL